jgi:hypothetical protein
MQNSHICSGKNGKTEVFPKKAKNYYNLNNWKWKTVKNYLNLDKHIYAICGGQSNFSMKANSLKRKCLFSGRKSIYLPFVYPLTWLSSYLKIVH